MALELVSGPLMGAVFNVLLERLASSEVVNFFKKKKSSDRLLKKMKIMLLSVNAVLNDAEEKQMKNEAVKEWIEELKDVTFDADDLLDEIYTDAKISEKEEIEKHRSPNNKTDLLEKKEVPVQVGIDCAERHQQKQHIINELFEELPKDCFVHMLLDVNSTQLTKRSAQALRPYHI